MGFEMNNTVLAFSKNRIIALLKVKLINSFNKVHFL